MFTDKFPIDSSIELPAIGSWPQTNHLFDEESLYAIQAALGSQRPLLIRGEPGTGKSQLARAAAHCLNRAFVSEVVNAKTECQDLQWSFDAVARLGEAQTVAALGKAAKIDDILNPKHFLSPAVLWWVFDWKSAQFQYENCKHNLRRPEAPANWQPNSGCVLLIDEIDKADMDLPNGLLETLGNGAFHVPYLDEAIGYNPENEPPLVIITTNEDKELPNAFVRRCMVLNLDLPKNDEDLIQWLVQRGEIHFSGQASLNVMQKVAEQLLKDRKLADTSGPMPGQAEYLDIIRALARLTNTEKEQLDLLDKIAKFAVKKSRS